jgi:hypothetical protein
MTTNFQHFQKFNFGKLPNTKQRRISCVESHGTTLNQYVGTPCGGGAEGGRFRPDSCDYDPRQETNRTRPSCHQSAYRSITSSQEKKEKHNNANDILRVGTWQVAAFCFLPRDAHFVTSVVCI